MDWSHLDALSDKNCTVSFGQYRDSSGSSTGHAVREKFIVPKGFKKKDGTERQFARYEGFFIIILGEGASFFLAFFTALSCL